MDDGQDHHAGLYDTKPLKKRDGGSHSEGCENGNDQDHRVKSLKMILKHFVLEFPPEKRS